ncbi:MAG: ComF family protein [bacterium]
MRVPGDAVLELPGRIWLARARSCFAYEGRLRDALQSMKYSKRLDLARFFGQMLAEDARALGDFDRVTCVPMSGVRIRRRGYNPVAILARAVAAETNARLDLDALLRVRDSVPQVGLPREERVKNVVKAFEVPEGHRWHIERTRVLLIDDVLTTGATANDCARALIRAGADEVLVLTVARAL